MELSLQGDPGRERCARGNEVLQRLGEVQCNGSVFTLEVKPMSGDGFCWYPAIVIGSGCRRTMRRIRVHMLYAAYVVCGTDAEH